MNINMDKLLEFFEDSLKKEFFNEHGVFKYLKGEEEISFNLEGFQKEHSNVSFLKKTTTIGDFRFYAFNSNDFLGGGVLIINKFTGQTAIAFSISLSSKHYHGAISSSNFEEFKFIMKGKEDLLKRLSSIHYVYSRLQTSDLDFIAMATEFNEDILWSKNNTKLLSLCFAVVHELIAFESVISSDLKDELKNTFLNLAQKITHHSYLYNIPRNKDEAFICIRNKHVVEALSNFRKNHQEDFYNLKTKEVLPQLLEYAEYLIYKEYDTALSPSSFHYTSYLSVIREAIFSDAPKVEKVIAEIEVSNLF